MDIRKGFEQFKSVLELDYARKSVVLEGLRDNLIKLVAENGIDIEAISLLTLVEYELKMDTPECVAFLEEAYRTYKDSLPDSKFAMLATNLAYFYIEEMGMEEEGIDLLEQAVKRGSPYAETYYGLGSNYFIIGEFEKAADMFYLAGKTLNKYRAYRRDAGIEDNGALRYFVYRYNEAVSLYRSSLDDDAVNQFEELSDAFRYNYIANEDSIKREPGLSDEDEKAYLECSAKAYYCLGMIYGLKGKIATATEHFNNIKRANAKIDDAQDERLAQLAFICEDYEDCVFFYDKADLVPDGEWLKFYFYALHKCSDFDRGLKKARNIFEKCQDMNHEELESFEDDSIENVKIFIDIMNERLKKLNDLFVNYFENGEKPQTYFYPDIEYVPYYIVQPDI